MLFLFAEKKIPTAQMMVKMINEILMAKMIASAEAEANVIFPMVTATTVVTIAILRVWPMERLVAVIDEATL